MIIELEAAYNGKQILAAIGRSAEMISKNVENSNWFVEFRQEENNGRYRLQDGRLEKLSSRLGRLFVTQKVRKTGRIFKRQYWLETGLYYDFNTINMEEQYKELEVSILEERESIEHKWTERIEPDHKEASEYIGNFISFLEAMIVELREGGKDAKF